MWEIIEVIFYYQVINEDSCSFESVNAKIKIMWNYIFMLQ